MRKLLTISLLALAIAQPLWAETDQEVNARKNALDLAGAFSNDGFKIRDGHWSGTIQSQQREVIAVNLYAGNQYWFTAAASEAKAKVRVDVYDETGRKATAEMYDSNERAAAGFSPTNSGQYFIVVTLLEGGPAGVSLICSYK